MPEDATADRLTLDISEADGTATVRCSGKLVWGVTNLLYDETRALMPGNKRIVLDLTDLTHMDSMGIGTLVRVKVACKAAGCDLELINVGARIRQLLSVTKLLSVFAICGEQGIRIQ